VVDFFEPAGRGVQHASLRAANRRAVLTTIAFNPGISNADVSRRTGLAPQTASAIVSELEEDGLVTRGEVLRGRRGQPATPLSMDYSGAYAFGCEVSWRHIDLTLINLGTQQIGHYRRNFAYPDARTVVAEIAKAVADLSSRLTPEQLARVAGLGVASPTNIWRDVVKAGGPTDQALLWQEIDLAAALEKATGLPTTWFNDGTCACLAEMVTSPAPRPPSFVHLFVSTFLGGGITAEHMLWEGPTGNSANLGSMLVNGRDGHRRSGHDVASTTALAARLARDGIALPGGEPGQWPWADWEQQLAPWIADSGSALAEIAFNTAAVIEVDQVTIDSVVPREIVDRLVAATETELASLTTSDGKRPRVVAGKLGARAAPLGAALLPMFRKHFSRDLGDMLAAEEG
jgi:predicted NBD/HSP70 family sugar kinase